MEFQKRGMKKKTINAVISKKFNAWLSSIDDPTVKKVVEKNTVITGGCIVSMLLGEKINDFDVYFSDKETTMVVAKYYVEKFNADQESPIASVLDMDKVDPENNSPGRIKIQIQNRGVAGELNFQKTHAEQTSETEDVESSDPQYLKDLSDGDEVDSELLEKDKKPYRPVFMSSNAITLSSKIQLIIRFYGDPDKIHENYDFIHCTNYWTPVTGVVLRQAALECILSRSLVYQGSKYPVCSIIRLRKFLKRGWQINAGQMLKIMFQISNLDLTNLNVLEDQLIGVDTAYFSCLIDSLKKAAEGDPEKINYGYIVSVIEKIFD